MQPITALHNREWAAVLLFSTILIILTILSLRHPTDIAEADLTPHYIVPPSVLIIISGAVEKPGTYTVDKGTSVLEAIEEAKPLANADLKKFKATSKVRNRQKIVVPEKTAARARKKL